MVSVCGACGAAFQCGAADAECWCSAVELEPEARVKLASDYEGCLCPSCLRDFAGRPEAGT